LLLEGVLILQADIGGRGMHAHRMHWLSVKKRTTNQRHAACAYSLAKWTAG